MNTNYFKAGRRSGKQEFTRAKMEEMVNTMSEDGHKYFFGQMPEMPWKRKEREMDNEFKKLVIRYLALLVMVAMFGRDHVADIELEHLVKDSNEYARRLG